MELCVFTGGFAGLLGSAGLDVQKCWTAAAAEDGLWNCCWCHSPSQTQLSAQVTPPHWNFLASTQVTQLSIWIKFVLKSYFRHAFFCPLLVNLGSWFIIHMVILLHVKYNKYKAIQCKNTKVICFTLVLATHSLRWTNIVQKRCVQP